MLSNSDFHKGLDNDALRRINGFSMNVASHWEIDTFIFNVKDPNSLMGTVLHYFGKMGNSL